MTGTKTMRSNVSWLGAVSSCESLTTVPPANEAVLQHGPQEQRQPPSLSCWRSVARAMAGCHQGDQLPCARSGVGKNTMLGEKASPSFTMETKSSKEASSIPHRLSPSGFNARTAPQNFSRGLPRVATTIVPGSKGSRVIPRSCAGSCTFGILSGGRQFFNFGEPSPINNKNATFCSGSASLTHLRTLTVKAAVAENHLPPKTNKSQGRKADMPLRINDEAPNFTADTTQGQINFHEWIGNGWAILFSHPKDFTPVCTTELGYMAGLQPEFTKRNCKILGLSVDPVGSHGKWSVDIEETQGHKVNYPMVGDPELKVAKLYDMLPADAGSTSEGRTAATNATVRTVFVIGPDKKIKLMLSYPMSTGRNFDEVLRVLDSIQLTAKHQVATPVNWKQGQDVIILTSVSDEDAKKKFPQGWKAPRPYLRIVSQPK